MTRTDQLLGRTRTLLVLFIIGLVLSGLTAFPLQTELDWLTRLFGANASTRPSEVDAWVVTFGMVACAAVIPLALIAGAVREIPPYWRAIDCAFGLGGAALLWPCRLAIRELERQSGVRSAV